MRISSLPPSLSPPTEDGAPTQWLPPRRAARECDRAMTGTARQWLRRLPPRRRPLRLCEQFPRVANRLAWCWGDPAITAQLLDDLLLDGRGGRRGFAPGIVRELQRLHEFNARQRVEATPETLIERISRVLGFT